MVKNDHLCAWRDLKKIYLWCNVGMVNFKAKFSPIFDFDQVTDVRITTPFSVDKAVEGLDTI